MAISEPSPAPTKRPYSKTKSVRSPWGPSTPSPAEAPNTVRRMQGWSTVSNSEPSTTESYTNSKNTYDPTEEPTAMPTFDSGFCGNGLDGCSVYINDCEEYCQCDWHSGISSCSTCSLGEGTVCISCLSGWTLSGGECQRNGAFTDGSDGAEDGVSSDFWMGIGVGFVFCAAIMICVGILAFLWRNNKAVVSVDDHDDDIKLTDDQQLQDVNNTTIQLNESVNLHETDVAEMEE